MILRMGQLRLTGKCSAYVEASIRAWLFMPAAAYECIPGYVDRDDESAKPGTMQRQHSLPVSCLPSRSDARRCLQIRQTAGFELIPPAREVHDGWPEDCGHGLDPRSACSPVHQLTN